MAYTNFITLVSGLTISGAATSTVEIDTTGFTQCQLYIAVTYPTTSSTTGLLASATDGCGFATTAAPPVATNRVPTANTQPFYDSVGSILTLNPVIPSAGTSQTVVTRLNLALTQIGNWYKLTFKNNDASVAATIAIYADAG